MYQDISFKDFDCEEWTMQEMIDGTYEIYTKAEVGHFGDSNSITYIN